MFIEALFTYSFLKLYLVDWTYLSYIYQTFQTSKVNLLPSNSFHVYLFLILCFNRSFSTSQFFHRSYMVFILDFPISFTTKYPLSISNQLQNVIDFNYFNTSQVHSLHFIWITTSLSQATLITCLEYNQIVSNFCMFFFFCYRVVFFFCYTVFFSLQKT